ncbi:branched-chain amino acid ABC transporter permease [uncultured Hydrogenophaga sp.]|uniref:branched-chain amino acid ABC transporter permease n=1 Tax=uncultured Hydrogenophaga sp. TaxID=199683 RepID=UPI00258E911D|nr:branched-chain amino acid ABC transporter permease [uncultured Hydrogenophaga sp.]
MTGCRWLALAALIALLLAAPLVVSGYLVFQLSMILVLSIALLGLNLVTGYSGQTSLGHGAFYAIGAYTMAIAMEGWSVPYPLALLLAGLVAGVVGWLIGLPALRLHGHQLALATFAVGVTLPQLLKSKSLSGFTGGSQGLVVIAPSAPWGLALTPEQWVYYLCVGSALLLFALAALLVKGKIGRALVALRDHPIAATTMGVPLARYKTSVFALSAAYTGVAGALGALTVQFIAPDSFSMLLSISLLVGVVVGGLATLSGAVWGAVFIQLVPNVAESLSKSAPWLVYGVLLVAVIVFMPSGIAGTLGRLRLRASEPDSSLSPNPLTTTGDKP